MISRYLNDTHCPLTGDRCYGECVLYDQSDCKLEGTMDAVQEIEFDLPRIADVLEGIAKRGGQS